MHLLISNTHMIKLWTSKVAYPWVQFGWHGWHSRSWSAYLKMKLFAPCKPSGHFSTQFGPSLKWEHFVQLSGPWSVEKKKNRGIKLGAISSGMYSSGLVTETSVGGQSSSRELKSIFRSTNGDAAIVAFWSAKLSSDFSRRTSAFSFCHLFLVRLQCNDIW